jgi:hypothetical protein
MHHFSAPSRPSANCCLLVTASGWGGMDGGGGGPLHLVGSRPCRPYIVPIRYRRGGTIGERRTGNKPRRLPIVSPLLQPHGRDRRWTNCVAPTPYFPPVSPLRRAHPPADGARQAVDELCCTHTLFPACVAPTSCASASGWGGMDDSTYGRRPIPAPLQSTSNPPAAQLPLPLAPGGGASYFVTGLLRVKFLAKD